VHRFTPQYEIQTKNHVLKTLEKVAESTGSILCHVEIHRDRKIRSMKIGVIPVIKNEDLFKKSLKEMVESTNARERIFVANRKN